MTMSERGLALTMESEGLRVLAYRDGAGLWTIGYGHVSGVAPGMTCTPEEAEQWLREDISVAERAVSRLVRVALNPSQFDALCDFTFNLGAGALGGSTLLRKLNGSDYAGAAAEFSRWVHDAAGNVEPGLVTRRAREKQFFETGDWS
jgi:lysozyme